VKEGLALVSNAFQKMPDAVKACHGTETDVAELVHALAQLANPEHFLFHMGKNLIVNHHDIFKEVSAAIVAYEAQQFESCGADIGQALRKLVVSSDLALEGSSRAAPLAVGLVEGLLGGKTELKACLAGSRVEIGDLAGAVRDFKREDRESVKEGLALVSNAFQKMPDAVKACHGTETDVAELVHALAQLANPEHFLFHMGKNLIVNHHDIFKEVSAAIVAYEAQQFESCGADIGQALRKLVIGRQAKFQEFVKEHGKQYESEREWAMKYSTFLSNMQLISSQQCAEEGDATYSHRTPFADMSPEEFSQSHGWRSGDLEAHLGVLVLKEQGVNDLPESFDWREKGAVNPVKNQKQCGSCWAFATVANIEGVAFAATGKLLSLSEQQLVDCDKDGDQGCNGGLPSNALTDLIKHNMGLETERDYPYGAVDQKCRAVPASEGAFVVSWAKVSQDEDEIAATLTKYGPLAIGINAAMMQFYFGGVANPPKLLCNPKTLDHGVAMVGFGVGGRKQLKYWVIRNSWGPGWGEKGYYRIVRGRGACGLNTMVTTATQVQLKDSLSEAGSTLMV